MKNRISTQELIMLNPNITYPEEIIAGKQVYLPSYTDSASQYYSLTMPGGGLPTCPAGPVPIHNSWIPITSLEQMARNEYDVLSIGSGAGGGSVLRRLCEHSTSMVTARFNPFPWEICTMTRALAESETIPPHRLPTGTGRSMGCPAYLWLITAHSPTPVRKTRR